MKKVLALVLALCMTLCVAQAAMADMLSDIQEKGTLVVGANVGFPPYEFYYTNPETGEEELQGFDMKLAQAIADELGVEMVLADQTFAGLITALRAGEIDMIASGMAIREQIGRFKYVSEDQVKDTFKRILKELEEEAARAAGTDTGKEGQQDAERI